MTETDTLVSQIQEVGAMVGLWERICHFNKHWLKDSMYKTCMGNKSGRSLYNRAMDEQIARIKEFKRLAAKYNYNV